MALTSSYTVEHAQSDGRKWVREKHVDAFAREHFRTYLSTDAMDKDAILAAHAVQIEDSLKTQEAQECIDQDKISLEYITKAELAAIIREIYRNGSPEVVVKIARWIRRRIIAGDFTETQVRNAFGLTVNQWDALKIKLQAMDEALTVFETAVGE
jgi:hypothetical protein